MPKPETQFTTSDVCDLGTEADVRRGIDHQARFGPGLWACGIDEFGRSLGLAPAREG
jgi:hypothetical protein